MKTPFYDPLLTYEENYQKGPSGGLGDSEFLQKGEPDIDFLGQKIYLPFGIPAGPLLNSKYCAAAFKAGFDVCVYKTVRAQAYKTHEFPNVLAVEVEGDLTPEKLLTPLVATNNYKEPLSITNSFGVPSRDPITWQEDVKKAMKAVGKGQVLILSFMGTVLPNETQEEFIKDFILAAHLAKETGAKILEANLSCPNIGNEGLVCYNLEVTEAIVKGIRENIGNVPLILKVGYYREDKDMEKLAAIADKYADDVAGINTLQATVVDRDGMQVLPGENRLRSGICGAGIKWAGLDFVKRMKKIKDTNGYNFSITGVGGVMNPEDYKEYKDAGADCVMSATGAMWNPELAKDIKIQL